MRLINPKHIKNQNSEGGSIIIYTILILLVVLTIAIALMRLILPKFKIVRESVYSVVALYAADSAAEWCLDSIRSWPPSITNLIGYWALDDGSGSIAVDSSTSGQNGTLFDNPPWVAGKIGNYAVSFDGNLDAIDIGLVTVGSIYDIDGTPWTMAAWVKWNGIDYTSGIFAFGDAQSHKTGLGMGNAANLGRFHVQIEAGDPDITTVCMTNPIANTWYHLAATWNGSNTVTLYLNGQQCSQTTGTTTYDLVGDRLDIGTDRVTSSGNSFGGLIDDVRIYSRVLSEEEINQLIPPSPPVMLNGSTYQVYYPSNSSDSATCTQTIFDHRMVGTYRDISRSLQLF